MALEAEQGRSETAISHGQPSGRLSRGFPSGETRGRAFARGSISQERVSGGTETSKYPEERKSTETPSVAASEGGSAQTGCD